MILVKKNWVVVAILLALIFLPSFALAQDDDDDISDSGGSSPAKILNPLGENGPGTVQEFIQKLLVGLLRIGIPIIALAIIYSGFLFVSARGNPESLKKAKETFVYTIIGAAILLGAWAIAELIADTVLEIGAISSGVSKLL